MSKTKHHCRAAGQSVRGFEHRKSNKKTLEENRRKPYRNHVLKTMDVIMVWSDDRRLAR